jgi:uncharacterized hydrophobic protein (TIGR00341 family)
MVKTCLKYAIGNGKNNFQMALRLIEMVAQEKDCVKICDLLKKHQVVEYRQVRLLDDEVLIRILVDVQQSEVILDLLEQRCLGKNDIRLVVLPVEATLPRSKFEQITSEEELPKRIGREELYEDIKEDSRCSWVFIAMVILSTIVAIVGLSNNSVTILIGAMMIAPLSRPNIALAFGTILGDLPLLGHALRTNLIGIGIAVMLSVIAGIVIKIDPTLSEVTLRTHLKLGEIAVALASGCAGALAFTAGIPVALVGVMVAVALLPPLVTFGLLLGGGHLDLAVSALCLFAMNLICVNLASVITFLLQRIHPVKLWEKARAMKAIWIAIWIWLALLAILVIIILLLRKSWL